MYENIKKAFEQIGARIQVRDTHVDKRWQSRFSGGFTLDIINDKKGEIYDLRIENHRRDDLDVVVVDRKPDERHLLLMVKDSANKNQKTKLLCGHDEFHWFAAPVHRDSADVARAKESLKPKEVRELQGRVKKKSKAGVKRQGEWFFVPKRRMKVPHNQIMKNEPVQREGGGKPHVIEEVYRTGGESVYVSSGGKVLSTKEFSSLQKKNPELAKFYRPAKANAKVFGRGKVRHPDHSTLELPFWHEILPNAESDFSTRSLRFID